MPLIKAIISDADGTLVNTVPLIRHGQHETAVTFLRNHGVPEADIPSYDKYEVLLNKSVGGSARQTLELTVKALYRDKTHHLEYIDYDELHRLLNPIQDRLAPEFVKPFPSLAETLGNIGALGVKLAIFSSGTPHHIVRNFGIALADEMSDYATLYQDINIDDHLKLKKFIQRMESVFNIPELTVVTADDVGDRTKPDPLSVELAIQQFGVSPSNALILGDHSYDIQAGKSAGIPALVGVTHGFDDRDTLLEAGATNIIDSLAELPALLTK